MPFTVYAPLPEQGHHSDTAILVHNNELQSPLQAVAVKVFLSRPYRVYIQNRQRHVPVERGDVDRLVRDFPSTFLLLRNFTGRHPLWNDDTTNPKGNLIASFIQDEGLDVLNSRDMTHF